MSAGRRGSPGRTTHPTHQKADISGKTRTPSTRLTWAVVAALALSLAAMAAISVAKDRNGDKIPDRWEKRHHLSLKVDQARRDQDSDALRNRGEYEAGMDPQ